ncbi:unnamed protein product [Urochloa decumbens]|uniref:Phytocyanin domain-containing protein n=1 Tax=Urochloa decumbens TaxID=240449 RepID=A0ABC9DFU4_9POAL
MAGRVEFFVAVVSALVVVSAAFLAGSASASWHAQVFVVGGEPRGWTQPAAPDDETYNHWAARNRFHVGDFLHFKYDTNDSVLVVSRDDYKFCGTSRPAQRFDGGDTRVRLDRSGFSYYISGAPGHCDAGQRMTVRVLPPLQDAAATPAPEAEAPAAAMAPGGGGGEDEGGSFDPPPGSTPPGRGGGGGGGSTSGPAFTASSSTPPLHQHDHQHEHGAAPASIGGCCHRHVVGGLVLGASLLLLRA